MKSVLCFISSLSGGGAERQMLELVSYLVEKGYVVKLLTYASHEDYACVPEAERISVRSSARWRLALRLRRAIRRCGCDCVVSFMQQNNMVAALATFPYKKFGLIVSERSLSVKPAPFERLLFRLYRRCDRIVPNSVSQSEFIRTQAPELADRIVTIGNFTDTARFIPRPEFVTDDGFLKIGVFARYVFPKNPMVLARALEILRRRGTDNVKVYWFGSRNPNKNKPEEISACYEELERYIAVEGLKERFLLNTFSPDPVADINRMDAVAMPSFREGFSNAISEGMACGKPILASAVGDNTFLVKEGVNGFLFDPGDAESAADAVERLVRLSAAERAGMGRESRRMAEEMFSRERFGESYVRLIEDACGRKNGRK